MVYTVNGQIRKAVSVPLPENMVQAGVILSMDAMGDFIRTAARETGIPRTNAAVVLPEALVATRNVSLPVMTAAQLKYNIPYELKDYLSEEKDQYFYDYAMYPRTDAAGEMALFACAVRKSTVADYRAMFRRAGFRLKAALPEAWAGLSALGRTPGPVCLVDIGYGSTRVHMMAPDCETAMRSIPLGLQQVEKEIAEYCHVDIHTARSYGHSDFGGILDADVCRQIYGKLGIEIRKTVSYWNAVHRNAQVQSLCLCGGGTAIAPLAVCIRQATGLPLLPLGSVTPRLAGQEAYWKAYGCTVRDSGGAL